MPPKNWGQLNRINQNNRDIQARLARLAVLDAEEDDPLFDESDEEDPPRPPRAWARRREQRPPVPIVPRRKAPPRAPRPPAQDDDGAEDEDVDEEEDDELNRLPQFQRRDFGDDDEDEDAAMMMRPAVPRPAQGLPQRGRNLPQGRHVPVRQQGRRPNEPMGTIRHANGQLRSAVSWMFTIRLSNDPRRVNYFPYEQDPRRMQMLNGRYVRPYVVPSIASLNGRRNAPVFLLYQLEQGNNGVLDHNGNPLHDNLHYQGFMEFESKVSAVEICAVMGWTLDNGWNMGDVWLEPRQGRKQDAIAYVTKDDTAFAVHDLVADFALGEINANQFANDVNRLGEGEDGPLAYFRQEEGQQRPPDAADLATIVTNMIEQGASYHDILKAYPSYAMQRSYGIKSAIEAIGERKPRKLKHRPVQTFVFWGDSRTGKSRKIAEMEGDENLEMDAAKVYIKNRKEDYFQQYVDHEVLVLDEYVGASTGERIKVDDLLRLLDGQPLSLSIKHESPRFAQWKRVYITSNIPPRLWFPGADKKQLEALYFRLETGGIYKFVDTSKPESVEAHEAEVISQTYLRDRANVIMRPSAHL